MVTNSRFVGHSDITPSLAGNVRIDRQPGVMPAPKPDRGLYIGGVSMRGSSTSLHEWAASVTPAVQHLPTVTEL
jgi:hypothetical protein